MTFDTKSTIDSYTGFWITRVNLRTGEQSVCEDEATESVLIFSDSIQLTHDDPANAYNRANTYIREVLPSGFTYQVQRGVVKPLPKIEECR